MEKYSLNLPEIYETLRNKIGYVKRQRRRIKHDEKTTFTKISKGKIRDWITI